MELTNYETSIEQIAAGLVHEVKNPLSLVKANIDLLELNDQEVTNKRNYMIMRREIERINDLLLDFIQFTKPIEPVLEKIEIVPILTELIDTVKATYNKKINFAIMYEKSDENIYILGDSSKIRRVFLNIIKNAVEAVEEGGKIELIINRQNGDVKIVCKDNGKGLDAMEVEKISSPFYTTKQGGSGLGLFISKTLIKEHKGAFKIEGEVDKGCRVTIKIPMMEKE